MAAISTTETMSTLAAVRRDLQLIALSGVPLVREGDDLCELILAAVRHSGEQLHHGDVLVLAQKIVSKARGRYVDLRTITPSARALELAKTVEKDARLIELILRESTEVLRVRRDVIIVAHHLGFVMANAGIDFSNVDSPSVDSSSVDSDTNQCRALLLPEDPDKECEQIRRELRENTGSDIGVVLNDSHGRAWRNGTVGVAIGAAGVQALADMRGKPDLFGRAFRITQVGVADEIAGAASLLMGQSDEGLPAVLIRGLAIGDGRAADLIRPREIDLFR
jgi:coenzyme F420-0:L-glutamate ligase/coenzyme F420-1:gamma-L-glutamate ligase